VLLDPGCLDMRPYALKHHLTQRAALWRDLIKVIKRLGWHEPPAVAVDVSREADSALLHNLQLLLRVGTAGGGIASRSATALSTLAAAVEGLRDPSLNMLAACARHDVRAFGHGPTLTAHTLKAIKHVQQQLVELGLIVDGDVAQPELVQRRIEPNHVAAVQRLATVSVADAARALAELGDRGADMGAAEAVEAACASLRAARGEVAHDPATPTTPATAPATPRGGGGGGGEGGGGGRAAALDDPILIPLSARLKVRSVLPNVSTTAAALAMCRDPSLSAEDACARCDIATGTNRKGNTERVIAVRDRLRALGPLETVLAAAAAAAAATAESAVGTLPLEDEAWLAAVQARLGPVPAFSGSGGPCAPAALPFLRVALEFLRASNQPLPPLCAKHGVCLALGSEGKIAHVRNLRDRLRACGVAEVPPAELTHPTAPPCLDEALLTSLQLRLTLASNFANMPRAEDVAAAHDLVSTDGLELATACYRRRIEFSTARLRRIERLRARLAELPPPLDARVNIEAVERVRELVRRSGLESPAIATIAAAVLACDADVLKACNRVRAELGAPPADPALLAPEPQTNPSGGGGGGGGGEDKGLLPLAQPPPISDELLHELRRRVAARLGRAASHLPDAKFFRAAADLVRDETRAVDWRRLNVPRVCTWHGIDLTSQAKSRHETLRQVLYLPYISPISPLYLPYVSPISPLYLPYISPISPAGARVAQAAASPRDPTQQHQPSRRLSRRPHPLRQPAAAAADEHRRAGLEPVAPGRGPRDDRGGCLPPPRRLARRARGVCGARPVQQRRPGGAPCRGDAISHRRARPARP